MAGSKSTPLQVCKFCNAASGKHLPDCPGENTQVDPDLFTDLETTRRRDFLIGSQVGDYVIQRRIGVGGTGIVYEGFHPLIERKAAIKILRPDVAWTDEQKRLLLTEARAANAIQHRGIINIFGFGEIPDLGPYLVMEFLDGTPLDELIDKQAPLGEETTLRLLDQVLDALRAAHSAGVLHRDLKPSNVFVVREGSAETYAKLLDFGFARHQRVGGKRPDSGLDIIVGTPEYMSPEQAAGDPIGPQSDLYALGTIAFEMLTRHLPAEGKDAVEVIQKKLHQPAPPISAFVRVNDLLQRLIARMLVRDPNQRIASAAVARAELHRVMRSTHQRPTLTDKEALHPPGMIPRRPTPTDLDLRPAPELLAEVPAAGRPRSPSPFTPPPKPKGKR